MAGVLTIRIVSIETKITVEQVLAISGGSIMK